MTRIEAWAHFAAASLQQLMVGTTAHVAESGTELAPQSKARVALAALYADAMTAEWSARMAGHTPAEPEKLLRKRTPESKL